MVFDPDKPHFYGHRPDSKSFIFAILYQIGLSYLYALDFSSLERVTLGWKFWTILLALKGISCIAISYASRA